MKITFIQTVIFMCSELLGDVLAKRPVKEDGIDTLIVVDNVPIVGQDRLEKLKNVIRKVFSKFGKIVNEFYPEEDGKTKGLANDSISIVMFLDFVQVTILLLLLQLLPFVASVVSIISTTFIMNIRV